MEKAETDVRRVCRVAFSGFLILVYKQQSAARNQKNAFSYKKTREK
ncbi:MAG: hypothetical protein MSH66_08240 [Bacteroidales bacterium]|nr:hypothetical protein [Bacteroidales bacterium]